MSAKPRSFYIAGAGVAGLTLALALAKSGANVTVLERNDEIQEFGAGLQIGPNARRALNFLGLDAATRKVSFEPKSIEIYNFTDNSPLTSIELGASAEQRYGVPYAVMHRADLVQTLYAACKDLPNINILFAIKNINAEMTDGQLTVSYTMANDAAHSANPFAFIGADGVGSLTRTRMLGGKEALYSGYVAWRILLQAHHFDALISLDRTSVFWGPEVHAVIYPLPHRGTVNVVLFTKEVQSLTFGLQAAPRLPNAVHDDHRFASILESAGENWTHWPLASVTTPCWHKDAIGIIGDAAHGMLPFQAQGAAMGIEDAAILAPLLTECDSAGDAFERFYQARQHRVARVQQLSAANGRIFHMHPPFTIARNMAVRLQGPSSQLNRLSWLYDYDPLAIKP